MFQYLQRKGLTSAQFLKDSAVVAYVRFRDFLLFALPTSLSTRFLDPKADFYSAVDWQPVLLRMSSQRTTLSTSRKVSRCRTTYSQETGSVCDVYRFSNGSLFRNYCCADFRL